MNIYESFVSEKLKKMIAYKWQYFNKMKDRTAAMHLQEEIIFLQDEVLPAVQNGTILLYSEQIKYFIRCYENAIEGDCNGLLVYYPIKDDYEDMPRVGIANCRDHKPLGTLGALPIICPTVEIYNHDGCGDPNKIDCLTLPIR